MGLFVVARVESRLLLLLLLWPSVVFIRVACGRPVWLTEGDTLYLRWQTELGPLGNCAMVWPNSTETILPDALPPPDSNATVEHGYAGDGYQSGQCGLRVDNMTPGVGDWTLKATAANGRQHDQYTSRVTCIAKQWPRSNTIRVPIGTAVNITCGPITAVYCRMSEPSGEVSWRAGQCWVHVKSVGSHHLDTWNCWSVTMDSAAEVQYTVHLHAYREGAVTEVGSDQTTSEVRVFCNVRDGPAISTAADRVGGTTAATRNDVRFRSTLCKLTLPRDAQTLSLAYGRGTARYAYHGTADGDCGVSFLKPLRRSETGRWKCVNAMSNGRIYGGFVVVVHPNNTKDIPPLTVTTGKPLLVPKGIAFRVECSVPAEIDYCWLRHPNSTTIPVTIPADGSTGHRKSRYRYTGEGLSFGQCHVTITDASTSDTGAWLCALGLRNDRSEMYGTVDVTVSESVITTYQDELYATEGSRITLGCYTVEQQPIAYCRFLTPRQFGFAVDEKSTTPPRYTYIGQGLTAGHCGLSVDHVDESDYGNWTCAVKIVDSAGSEEVSTVIALRKPEGFTMVQIIGIVFCGTLISVMSLFFANHLITNPSAKTRKKIEKLELLEAVEIGAASGRRISARRMGQSNTHIVRTQPTRAKQGSIPRRI